MISYNSVVHSDRLCAWWCICVSKYYKDLKINYDGLSTHTLTGMSNIVKIFMHLYIGTIRHSGMFWQSMK